ncbi:MAG: valine--tRNA ligase [Candidatus Omnitrophica bacterium]|nr:valine--tRNA ligase [Candidatus Omnitrophota bacterium]
MNDIPKAYNPKLTEDKWYKYWEDKGLFEASIDAKKRPYTIVIPPPNITGILHMGHALNNAIQDILIRYKRMQGYEALWLPGTDHAGIATQNVVEKELAKENKKRQDLGREEFLKRVWKWREEYGNTIIKQLKKLGCSCDWSRTRFTMDEGLSDAVLEVFIRLYEKGLVYKGDYIINWCPRCQTALSDEEAQHRDVEGMLYYIKYPVKNPKSEIRNPKKEEYVIVATTRPETMLGDVAVAFSPKDKRYKHLKGKKLILPILNRELDAVFDRLVDPKFGTGALKVTPAHDPIDFQLGLTHGLTPVNVMNPDATMNKEASVDYEGMDRFECRDALLEDLKERGLLVKTEPHRHAVAHCYRCHTMVEPRLSKQWFVRMKPLAKKGIEAVKKKRVKFYPARWTKVYLNWMENIKDWCISRQIWWGHRIPVYYCNKCEDGIVVSKKKPDKCQKCGSADMVQDPDVLDTWFSSWLWPFSTLGWPGETEDLKYFYPTDTLVTAQEIIFFWVARMIMAGLEFAGEIPFSGVYIHGTVRDATGTKMSKSLGNIIDPLDIINEFGADALRFSIISITAVGQDVFLSKEKFEMGRNFANKIWNASRLVLMNLDRDKVRVDLCKFYDKSKLELKERWIVSRFYQTLENVGAALDSYKINEAVKLIYEFFWHEFCDWYLELAKSTFSKEDTQVILYKVLEKSLRMLHPFMPFVTEEIWQRLPHEGDSIMVATWPHIQKDLIDKKAESDMELIIGVITSIRNIRSTWRIEPKRFIAAYLKSAKKESRETLAENEDYIKRLARIEELKIVTKEKRPEASVIGVFDDVEIYVPLQGVIDYEKERSKLAKRLEELENRSRDLSGRLKNKKFLQNAPKEVIQKFKSTQEELKDQIGKLKSNLKSLS